MVFYNLLFKTDHLNARLLSFLYFPPLFHLFSIYQNLVVLFLGFSIYFIIDVSIFNRYELFNVICVSHLIFMCCLYFS